MSSGGSGPELNPGEASLRVPASSGALTLVVLVSVAVAVIRRGARGGVVADPVPELAVVVLV